MASRLDRIPDELLLRILRCLPPEDNLYSVPAAQPRLRRVANDNALWRYYCRSCFRHWHPKHNLADRLNAPADGTDWKQLFLERKATDHRAAYLLDQIIATTLGRHRNIRELTQLGYDVKEFLLRQSSHASDRLNDVLARKHFAGCILSSINKAAAIDIWVACRRATPLPDLAWPHPLEPDEPALRAQSGPSPEAAMGAFDMFVGAGPHLGIDEIRCLLDDIAARFSADHPTFGDLPTRRQALALCLWLRGNVVTGVQHCRLSLRKLRSCFLGQALISARDGKHESTPRVACTIYCAVAERLGIPSRCSYYPDTVVVIAAQPGESLDGGPLEPDDDTTQFLDNVPDLFRGRDRMYLDPFHGNEFSIAEIRQRVWDFAPGQTDFNTLVTATTTAFVVKHNATDIWECQPDSVYLGSASKPNSHLTGGNPATNRAVAEYAAGWASLILQGRHAPCLTVRLANLLRHVVEFAPEDLWLVQKYLSPMFLADPLAGLDPGPRWRRFEAMSQLDGTRSWQHRRNSTATMASKLAVGHIVRHQRLGYIGVITGWTNQWQPVAASRTAEPDGHDGHDRHGNSLAYFSSSSAAAGKGQLKEVLFYHVLSATPNISRLVVADKMLTRLHDQSLLPAGLLSPIGMHFKRFDATSGAFVSNMTEEYPDN